MEKNELTAEALDLIDSQDIAETHGISIDKLMYLLDTGQISAYERRPGKLKSVYPSMEPEKWERITGEKIPDPYPENGLTVSSERMRFQTSKYIRRIMGTSVPPLRKWIMMFLNMATIRRLPSH